MADYFWLTNIRTPVDEADSVFLYNLADYRLGPPRVAVEQERHLPYHELVKAGTVGVYTTVEAISKPGIKELTGWSAVSLGREILEEIGGLFEPEQGVG